jgi:hypothetical protein
LTCLISSKNIQMVKGSLKIKNAMVNAMANAKTEQVITASVPYILS